MNKTNRLLIQAELRTFISIGECPDHWDSEYGICNNISNSISEEAYKIFISLLRQMQRKDLIHSSAYPIFVSDYEDYDEDLADEQYWCCVNQRTLYEREQLQARLEFARKVIDYINELES